MWFEESNENDINNYLCIFFMIYYIAKQINENSLEYLFTGTFEIIQREWLLEKNHRWMPTELVPK